MILEEFKLQEKQVLKAKGLIRKIEEQKEALECIRNLSMEEVRIGYRMVDLSPRSLDAKEKIRKIIIEGLEKELEALKESFKKL